MAAVLLVSTSSGPVRPALGNQWLSRDSGFTFIALETPGQIAVVDNRARALVTTFRTQTADRGRMGSSMSLCATPTTTMTMKPTTNSDPARDGAGPIEHLSQEARSAMGFGDALDGAPHQAHHADVRWI
jgi:hypothetical protein